MLSDPPKIHYFRRIQRIPSSIFEESEAPSNIGDCYVWGVRDGLEGDKPE